MAESTEVRRKIDPKVEAFLRLLARILLRLLGEEDGGKREVQSKA